MKATGAGDYGKGVRDLVRGAWKGSLDYFSFVDGMIGAIQRGLTRAWHEGANECGIKPSELTQAEIGELSVIINTEIGYVTGFADDIFKNLKADGGKLTPLLRRAEMWGNRYNSVATRASATVCSDLKKKWVWNPEKEHCSSCAKLNGRVYRNSVWHKYNVLPQSRDLACHGYRCGCELVTTSDPVTPGRPPNIP